MGRTRTLSDRDCENCGKTFRPQSSSSRFCSRPCWYAAPGKKVLAEKQCAHCGTTFQPQSTNQRYCPGGECGNAAKRTASQTKVCEQCGTEFETRWSHVRFCSRSCSRLGQSRGAQPEGTRRVATGGYIEIKAGKSYPGASPTGWILEHRYVMQESLGRPLRKGETIHHKNGDRQNNRLENLELWAKAHPSGQSQAHCATCTCFDH